MASSDTNALSQRPGEKKAYTSKRAAGRAAMRAPGPAVAPDFNDEKVSAAKAQVPFAQFVGQVSFGSSPPLSTFLSPPTLPPHSTPPVTCRSVLFAPLSSTLQPFPRIRERRGRNWNVAGEHGGGLRMGDGCRSISQVKQVGARQMKQVGARQIRLGAESRRDADG